MFRSIMFKNPYKKEKKYFSHQTTRLNKTTSISFSKKKTTSKEGNHTTVVEIIECEKKKKKAKGAFLIYPPLPKIA